MRCFEIHWNNNYILDKRNYLAITSITLILQCTQYLYLSLVL